MNNRAHFGLVGFGTMNAVIDWKEMRCWKFIDPLHQQTLTAACFESWSRRTHPVTPQTSWLQVAVDFRFELTHGHAVVGKLHGGIVRTGATSAGLDDFGQW